MSHQERVAWVSLLTMAVTFGPRFILTAVDPPAEALPDLPAMVRLAAATLGQAMLLGVGYLFLRHRFPEDARVHADERDRAIWHQALHFACIAMIVGMILVGIVRPLHATGWKLINTGVFMIVLAGSVQKGAAICGYRRGLSA